MGAFVSHSLPVLAGPLLLASTPHTLPGILAGPTDMMSADKGCTNKGCTNAGYQTDFILLPSSYTDHVNYSHPVHPVTMATLWMVNTRRVLRVA